MRIGGVDGFPLIVELHDEIFEAFRLEIVGTGQLQFNEFEAWSDRGGELENLALRQPSTQSSSPVAGHGAAGGNSGRVHTNIGAVTSHEDTPWWQVTLAEPSSIHHIVLFNRIANDPDKMRSLRVLGQQNGEWRSLFDQDDQASVHAALAGRLAIDQRRMSSVLAHALTPQLSRRGTDDARIGTEVLAAWDETARIEQLATLLGELHDLLADSTMPISPAQLRILRAGAKLARPASLIAGGEHIRLISTTHCDRIDLHAWDGNADRPVADILPIDAPLAQFLPSAESSHSVDHWTPRLKRVASWETPGDCYAVHVDDTIREHPKWELRATSADGTNELVYDSLLLSGATLALLQTIASIGLDDFETLDAILAGLELEGKTQSAVAISQWFQVPDPGEDRFSRSLQEVELRSSLDSHRKPVTRTKHGYKTTHRFMDPVAYAKGTKRLLDVVASHRDFTTIFPAFGTLLGFIRSGGFIPHDDDSDLVVVTGAQSKDEMMALRDVLREHLSKHRDLKLYDGSKLPGRNLPVGFDQDGQWVHIDLFLTYHEGDEVMLFNDRLKSFDPIDRELLSLGRPTTIHGVKFDLPRRSEDLLEFWYGNRWQTPLTSYLLGYSWQQ